MGAYVKVIIKVRSDKSLPRKDSIVFGNIKLDIRGDYRERVR